MSATSGSPFLISQEEEEKKLKHCVSHFRLCKEHKLYLTEEEDQKRKLDTFVANGAEDWDIKNAVCDL